MTVQRRKLVQLMQSLRYSGHFSRPEGDLPREVPFDECASTFGAYGTVLLEDLQTSTKAVKRRKH